MRIRLFLFWFAILLSIAQLYAQSPAPVVQAAPTAGTVVQAPAKAVDESTATTLKGLREVKAANEELLKKQKATLETLDDLQKAADQIKIYTKRS
jgi:hypothetical protein